ncbi:Long-chain-fatty-acid--CoA ligase 5 [Grifola frondosa]|uniref:Long-chain-fatty-acid--CoA ligase 5 n=1 Tax=Grifola frondosa TaxID=5627 RepID=A0A1C7MJF1_GRIFR|nr:Long-chain-fatty-acid--CoA ligase 5 [Grifola frondosa]
MAPSDYLVTDDLTIILGLVAAGLFLLHSLYKPQSLVHPILLGRQSDVARVRNPAESAVYRNYGTGMLGRFPLRPTKDQQLLLDLAKPDSDAPRTLWSTKITNPELRERVSAFGSGIIRLAGLAPQESNVLLLLNDGIEFLISDLALASYSIPTFTLTSLSLLSPVLDSHPPSVIITHANFLSSLLEVIYDANESAHHIVIVVGKLTNANVHKMDKLRVLQWEDVEREGASTEQMTLPQPDPQEVFTVSFFSTPSGELQGTQLTHENLTAGVAATRALLPLSTAMSSLDTIISAFSLSTPYGRAVAYTAIYEGTSFATLESSKIIGDERSAPSTGLKDINSVSSLPIPSPTILTKNASYVMYMIAWRHKLAALLDGFLTKQSLWDRVIFDGARVKVMGKGAGTVRAIIVSAESLEAQALTPSRIALSVPIVNAHIHPLIAGPVFASHPLDLQTFSPNITASSASAADAYAFTYLAPVGPPSVNIEAKLVGVDDEAVESGADPIGALHVRGPSVGKTLEEVGTRSEEERVWLDTSERAKVATNGTFKVVSAFKI